MNKKKIFSIICGIVIVVIFISVFTILNQTDEELNPALAFQVSESSEFNCIELSKDGIIYRPFGIIGGKSSLRQSKIGVRGDDSLAPIYSVKGFEPSEWIIETEDGFMTVGDMLYKSIDVQEIPKELEKYKQYEFVNIKYKQYDF